MQNGEPGRRRRNAGVGQCDTIRLRTAAVKMALLEANARREERS